MIQVISNAWTVGSRPCTAKSDNPCTAILTLQEAYDNTIARCGGTMKSNNLNCTAPCGFHVQVPSDGFCWQQTSAQTPNEPGKQYAGKRLPSAIICWSRGTTTSMTVFRPGRGPSASNICINQKHTSRRSHPPSRQGTTGGLSSNMLK